MLAASVLWAITLLAQTEPPKEAPPPDESAFAAARKIEDPSKKLSALQEILASFPKTRLEPAVRAEILRAAVKARPQDKKFIMDAAKADLKTARKESRADRNNQIAVVLLDANLYLPEAEKFALKGLAGHKKEKYFAERRAAAAKAKRPPPTEAELTRDLNLNRAMPLQTLGVLALKQGRTEEARRLLNEALALNPFLSRSLTSMAEIAEKDGDETKALDYLLLAKLTGRVPKESLASLNRLYEKKHGSLDTLESRLDDLYHSRFPSTLHVKRYEPSPARTARVVLAEFFTGSGCPPCAAADVAFDAVLERYSRKEVALIVYHQHIPQPDPMSFPAAQKRFDFYKRGGVPTYVIDGDKDGGGGRRENADYVYGKVEPKIEKRLTEAATANIALTVTRDGAGVTARVAVEPVTGDKRDLRLHVVLVEEMLRYSGENGIRFHPMVARSIASPENADGIQLEPGRRHEAEYRFDVAAIEKSLKAHLDDYEVNGRHGKIQFAQKMHEIDPRKLAVVAFVQDAGSSAVLQSQFAAPVSQSASVK